MTRPTSIAITPELFALVPGYRRGVVLARRASAGDAAAVERALLDASARCRSRIEDAGGVAELAPIRRWRRAFSAVGFDPTRTRPAVEALARRAAKGERLIFGDPLIDVGTAVSLEFLAPIGVHVLDDLDADLELARAAGDEQFLTFAGEVEPPEPGEFVYRCGSSILTRRWVWKQGRVGSVTEASRMFAINVDVLAEEDDLDATTGRLSELLGAAGAEVDATLTLTAERARASLPVRA